MDGRSNRSRPTNYKPMYCKTVQNKYSPVVKREEKSWFGFYLIENTLCRIGMGIRVIDVPDAEKVLNKFLTSHDEIWIGSFTVPNCVNCRSLKSYYYNRYAKSIMCKLCGNDYG